ncbi:MAG TPA: carboxypeptidase-like regulatory domain-containing protein, partial [Vicinamibacterales bacterium]
MPTLARALFAVALVVAAPAVTRAQVVNQIVPGTQVPPRDRVPPPTTGTASIKGRVVDGVTGAAIARARVRLMGVTRLPIATTDSAGAFTFKNLPAGGYSLSVDKATYQPGRYPDTSARTLRAMGGKPVILRDGEAADTITIPLFHGGAITGRILDAYGDPIDSADVRVLRVTGGKPQ